MKVIFHICLFFLMLSSGAKAQTTDIELNRIKKIGFNKYTIDGKGYKKSELEDFIIEKRSMIHFIRI